jgi:opacity protein-like surface antigen
LLPIGERFSLFGRLGLLHTEQSISVSGGGRSSQGPTQNGQELNLGLGAMFHLTRQLAVRAEWERAMDSEVNLLCLGLQLRF